MDSTMICVLLIFRRPMCGRDNTTSMPVRAHDGAHVGLTGAAGGSTHSQFRTKLARTKLSLCTALTVIGTERDNPLLGGRFWNVSSPLYSVPTSSAIAASRGRTRRGPFAPCPKHRKLIDSLIEQHRGRAFR